MPITFLSALGQAARFGRAVAIENDGVRRANISESGANVLAHGWGTGLTGDATHTHVAKIGPQLCGSHDHPPHKAGHPPQHRTLVPLDHTHGVVE